MARQHWQAVTGAALIMILSLAVTAPVHAGFLPGFEGYSVFGLDDQGNMTGTCPLCDSTANFAVWQNTDGNWLDDVPAATDLVGTSSGQESYVYFYQVVNTNPLGGSNQDLENFNISFGEPGTPVPFQTGGYLANQVFQNASNAVSPLDTPNDGSPSSVSTVTPFAADNSAFEPDSLLFDLIANAGVKGGAGFEGAQFIWDSTNLIGANATSSVMFLTSEIPPVYSWAETESPGGFGAAGDVPSVPEPGTLLLLAGGLLALGLGRDKS